LATNLEIDVDILVVILSSPIVDFSLKLVCSLIFEPSNINKNFHLVSTNRSLDFIGTMFNIELPTLHTLVYKKNKCFVIAVLDWYKVLHPLGTPNQLSVIKV
jgi:hypothetical protein